MSSSRCVSRTLRILEPSERLQLSATPTWERRATPPTEWTWPAVQTPDTYVYTTIDALQPVPLADMSNSFVVDTAAARWGRFNGWLCTLKQLRAEVVVVGAVMTKTKTKKATAKTNALATTKKRNFDMAKVLKRAGWMYKRVIAPW
ncbi:hypothetical protein PPROV_000679100 [Pycnococcus provasolii]|uniref:Uncharacterized protein n=1 Tax=Pycnococcus provasolii TaxID=41880 RepID=A0A830HST5_9CHLO|nr:hypothetical protein PPROV_000679100 [Pycnococcus provasolii]|mmetsp:Transcript_8402/g.19181  ORF Transcript_8402/g.19181 Transcript_8402/m.19181 type:complete len:146 (-) Transcript_8402:75-512(-)